MDTLISYGLAGLYYFAALGWLLLLLVGLVLLVFRGKRRWGCVALSVGVMWVGFHLYMEWTYEARYQRVVERFEEIEEGMSEAEVRRLLGKPSHTGSLIALDIPIPIGRPIPYGTTWQWVYQRDHWICYPVTEPPYWHVELFKEAQAAAFDPEKPHHRIYLSTKGGMVLGADSLKDGTEGVGR